MWPAPRRAREALALLGQEQAASSRRDRSSGRAAAAPSSARAGSSRACAATTRRDATVLSFAITMHQRPSTRANAVTTPAAGRLLIAGEHLAVVDERADLERARARIGEPVEALARGELALLVDALDVATGPSPRGPRARLARSRSSSAASAARWSVAVRSSTSLPADLRSERAEQTPCGPHPSIFDGMLPA